MFKESVVIALRALLANKMRSFLTMLGVIIGVGAVIAMVSIGMGVREKVQNSIASLGSNMLVVMPGAASSQGGGHSAAGSSTTLLLEDADYLKKAVKGVDYVAPFAASSTIKFSSDNKDTIASLKTSSSSTTKIRILSPALNICITAFFMIFLGYFLL